MKDERRFKDVIRSIKSIEKDKDKFLRDSRLSRHEEPRMSEETIFAMFVLLLVFGFLTVLFVFG